MNAASNFTDSLKPGDPVLVWASRRWAKHEVVKVTATQVVTTSGVRFRRVPGKWDGGNHYEITSAYTKARLEPFNQGKLDEQAAFDAEHEQRRELLGRIDGFRFREATTEQLRQVVDIITKS